MSTSGDSDRIWSAIEAYITETNKLGRLDSAPKAFIALAMSLVAKRDGSRESELIFLTNLSQNDLKRALEQLDRAHLIRINQSPRLIPTTTETQVYIPSRWARGKIVQRTTGPHVASYVLKLSGDLTVSSLESKFEASIEELLALVKKRIEKVDDSIWQDYVKFARIVLTEIRSSSIRARALYGEFLPRKINDGIALVLKTFDEIELNCETRQSALVLLERAIRLLNESLAEVHESH